MTTQLSTLSLFNDSSETLTITPFLKETKLFLPHPRVKVSIVGSLRDREVAYSASDRQGSNFESCVWRTVSSQSSHHPQEVLLAQFSLYVHKGGLKPDSFHFISLFNDSSETLTITPFFAPMLLASTTRRRPMVRSAHLAICPKTLHCAV